jgi:hypothetical protein
MKTASFVLSLLLSQSASAFVPSKSAAKLSHVSAATSTEEIAKTSFSVEEAYKYETSVNIDPKFKVKNVDESILDPKKRVQV